MCQKLGETPRQHRTAGDPAVQKRAGDRTVLRSGDPGGEAVSAAGSSLYEIFACGTSAISYSFVDNQEKIAEAFSNNKLIEYAGRINDEPHKTLNNIAKFIVSKGKNNNITNQNEIINIDGAELVANILFDELNTYDGA